MLNIISKLILILALTSSFPWLTNMVLEYATLYIAPIMTLGLMYILHHKDNSLFRIDKGSMVKISLVFLTFITVHASIGLVIYKYGLSLYHINVIVAIALILMIASSLTIPFAVSQAINSNQQINYVSRYDRVFFVTLGGSVSSTLLFIYMAFIRYPLNH
jgi:heme A synthase